MKVLITGSSGMLAKDIINEFANDKELIIHGADLIESVNPNIQKQHRIDLTDSESLEELLVAINPDVIIHTAAIVNLGVCEDNFNLAAKVHIDSSRILAKSKARMIYISSDSVFDGKIGNYKEESIPDPLNNYARTKYLGELAVQTNSKNNVIVRTNIFGFNSPLKGSLCEWAIKSFNNKEKISGYTDVIFNAIYTKHLAIILLNLAKSEYYGVLNIASSDFVSKYEFVKYLASKFGMLEEMIGTSKMEDKEMKIKRPRNTSLNVDKAYQLFNIPSIYEGLDQLVKDYTKDLKNERN
jgi:dTDP-4-dehydrorhamnose reductase